jgi:phosphoenolpyruvate carboxykinase (GTP)
MSSTIPDSIRTWVDEISSLTTPDRVVYCDGTDGEKDRLIAECLASGELIELNQKKLPGCYLHRSAAHDVARTEHLTFVSTKDKEDAGPNNNWMSAEVAVVKLTPLFKGAMKGRTMFVVPFLMGPPGSKFSRVGVEITDSRYVVLSMRTMTRVGQVALDHLGTSGDFTRCLHSLGDLSPDRRYIVHFPERNTVWSIGSGYGGNALLGKKCMALRIASWLAKREGWLAEHMLILGLKAPGSNTTRYITGAFPSACGKTNLAMLVPPSSMPGWQAWTVGDDIAWLRPGDDGRLWAVNPEAGFFGVVPGTSRATNPNAFDMIQRNTIFTNVALRPDGTPWWEGHDDPPPAEAIDWQGRPWTPASPEKAAHPNSRFTTPASQCASLSPEFDNPDGVPIDAILFGARRQRRVPLVYQARTWQHGTFLGASLSSETTAAATGRVGVLRRDSMAMSPFCGYNMADYFGHWLSFGRLSALPKIFRVNWFRTGDDGKFLWPGFGDNLRVLKWILERCEGKGAAVETPIGLVPTPAAIDRSGLKLSDTDMATLLKVDPAEWAEAVSGQRDFFDSFGARLPRGIRDEQERLAKRIEDAMTPADLRGRDEGA